MQNDDPIRNEGKSWYQPPKQHRRGTRADSLSREKSGDIGRSNARERVRDRSSEGDGWIRE